MLRDEMIIRIEAGEDPLEVSIKKWLDIVYRGGPEDGVANCGLCYVYGCVSCPVGKAGHSGCAGTPYDDYIESETLKDARAEVKFLKSQRKHKDGSVDVQKTD